MDTVKNQAYGRRQSVPVDFITTIGDDLDRIAAYLDKCGVPLGDEIYEDEENVPAGTYYVIFPDKKVVLYTPDEFEANFKMVDE